MTDPTMFYRIERETFTYDDPWGKPVSETGVYRIVEVVMATETDEMFVTMIQGGNGQLAPHPIYVSDDGRRFYKVQVGDYCGANGAAIELDRNNPVNGRWRAGKLSPHERYVDPNGQPIQVRNS